MVNRWTSRAPAPRPGERTHAAPAGGRGRAWALAAVALVTAASSLMPGPAWAQMPYQGYQPWQFRPMEPSNARGAPPAAPAPPQSSSAAPAQGQPGWPQGAAGPYGASQYPAGQYPASQYPAAQYPGGGYPGGQYPGGQYPGSQYPGSQYPAGQYPGGQYPGGQQPMQMRRPQMPAGQAPGRQYGASPYGASQYPGYGRGAASAYETPRLEVELTDHRPYVQENVLVRLRVISSSNLSTASPDFSSVDEVMFDTIEGPTTSTRGSGSQREIVNEFVLAMTPLRDGELTVGPIKVTGTLAGGAPFEAVASQPLRLQVRPPMAGVRPWLPLQTLQISAQLDSDGKVERGRPMTLTVEMESQGATGDQLPSLEPMLRSDDFRVYREQTLTDTKLDRNRQTLVGTRSEYYTLVPLSGGRLHLPELRLIWWNVETGEREASSVPIRTFAVSGAPGGTGFSRATEESGGDWGVFWLPLAGVALLLIGYWGGVWLRSRGAFGILRRGAGTAKRPGDRAPLGARLRPALTAAAAATGRGATRLLKLLDPTPLLRQGRRALAALTPKSARVYQCAREADHARDPAGWCLVFQQQACRRLQAGAREPLPRMADRIVDMRPGADKERVLQLMQQLDSALYNRRDIDFARWKREFRHALRPGTGVIRSLIAARVRRRHLPALNPHPHRI